MGRVRDFLSAGRSLLNLRPMPVAAAPPAAPLMDLPLHDRREESSARREALTLSAATAVIDADDYSYRRLSSGQKFKRRDLSPMAQDRMIEIAWFLWEQNPFAKRLITLMTDLVVGEGLGIDAKDPRVLEAAQKVWNHPINKLGKRAGELYQTCSVNGELILPVAVNDVTGVPTIGFIDPYQVDEVEMRPDNVLVPDFIRLKKMPHESEPRRIKIIQENPLTGMLDGECFYHSINKLANSSRGRSDFLAVADWLDLFDQFMFAEVERVRLLSAFVWDLEVKGATPEQVQARVNEIGTPQSGSVFAHNENEKMEAMAPTLNAGDRSETARQLTIHIGGSFGFPISWLGWQDSNRATIEGQNDVMLKTPTRRQKDFGGFLTEILRFGIERQLKANPALFRNVDRAFAVTMPEIAAKDIARVGQVLSSVIAGLDTAMANRTMSRRASVAITLALVKHLGLDLNAEEIMKDADVEADERLQRQDELMALMAKKNASRPGQPTNAPFGNEEDEEEEVLT